MFNTDHLANTPKLPRRGLFFSLLGIPLSIARASFRTRKALPPPESGLPELRWPTPVPLPYEIHSTILHSYVESLIYAPGIRRYRLERDLFTQRRKLMPVMLVSTMFGKLVHSIWNGYWPASRLLAENTWMLARPTVSFERFMQPVDLSGFARLLFASLDFKDAFAHTGHTWSLITLVAKLPSSLKEIEFLRVHAAEHEVIDLVSQLCPNVTTLRVVFCTMFNNPRCTWWAMHQAPTDHDHYMKGHELGGVKEYVRPIGRALHRLPRLEHLHFGVYFVSREAADTHRFAPDHVKHHPIKDSIRWIDHLQVQTPVQFAAVWASRHSTVPVPNIHLPCLADRKLWEAPCALCVRQWSERIERAERLAASILAVERPSLRTVSFASFVGDKRTNPSQWEVRRSDELFSSSTKVPRGHRLAAGCTQIQVWTKAIDAPAGLGQGHVFRWSDISGWEHVGHA